MQPEPYVAALKQVFPETAIPDLIAAHRQDPLVWRSLQDTDIFQKVLSLAGDHPEQWTPASISLLDLDLPVAANSLQTLPLISLDAELRQRAASIYEDTFRNLIPPANLGEACLLALALRERRRLTDSWQGLLNELQIHPAASPEILLTVWKTSMACLFGLTPDPAALLQALAPLPGSPISPDQIGLVIHPLLSNPLSPEQQSAILLPLLVSYEKPDQLLWLEVLTASGRDQLASLLAKNLLDHQDNLFSSKSIDPFAAAFIDPALYSENLQVLMGQRQLADYHIFAQNPTAAIPLLAGIAGGLRRFQARIAAQIGDASRAAGDPHTALTAYQDSIDLDPHSNSTRVELALALSQAGQIDEAWAVMSEIDQDPETDLARAVLSKLSGDGANAQEFAKRAARQVCDHQAKSLAPMAKSWKDPIRACQAFLNLDLPREAGDLASDLLAFRPTDVRIYRILTQVHKKAGNLINAAQAAHFAVLLQPDDIQGRRVYAGLLEESQDWVSALQERVHVNETNPCPDTSDLLAVARCAVNAHQSEPALRACKAVLSSDPDNGMAHIYLGDVSRLEHDDISAVEHYTQATSLAPDEPAGWLALSRMYRETGEHAKALEILRTGAHAAPQSAEIQYSMAEQYLASGSPTEALPALRRANFLSPESPTISIRLGGVLRDLGHLEESCRVFELARVSSPHHPELAYAHSKTLLAQGNKAAALPALLTTLESHPETVAPYLDYARLVLDDNHRSVHPTQAAQAKTAETIVLRNALTKVLELEPENLEAQILYADALEISGQYADALALYGTLSERIAADDPQWGWRVRLGIGRAALAVGQTDTALAALQEASTAQPGNLAIQQVLSETLRSVNFITEALEAARNALRLAPQDLANLSWFARAAYALGASGECITALERAVEIDPSDSENAFLLVKLHLQENNQAAAREVLENLLGTESLSTLTLWRSAHLWLALADVPAALVCLERACVSSPRGIDELYFEMAVLESRTGNYEEALISIEKAILVSPEDPRMPFFQAEVLSQLNRVQEALTSLYGALVLAEKITSPYAPGTHLTHVDSTLLPPPSYFNIQANAVDIYQRIARLLRQTGDVEGALTHAEKALISDPSSLESRYLAADLAYSLLEIERAYQMICSTSEPALASIIPVFDPENEDQRRTAMNLACLHAELELERGNVEKAAMVVDQAEEIFSQSARLLAVKARIESAGGNTEIAEDAWEAAVNLLNGKSQGGNHSSAWPFYPNSISPEGAVSSSSSGEKEDGYPTLSLAEAALHICQWDTAFALFDQAARSNPLEPRCHLSLSRALVLCAEAQEMLEEVRAVNHAPGGEKQGLTYYQKFEKAILTANRLSSSPLISRWHKRGQAAFNPDLETIRLFGSLPVTPDDSAALITACRRIGETQAAIDAASRFLDHPAVLTELSLLQRGTSPQDAFMTAQAALGSQPSNPVYLALFATLALETGNFASGQAAIEEALAVWENEPEWHLLAAGLHEHSLNWADAIAHCERAFHLDPENARYALALGQVHLKAGNSAEAVQCLENATHLDATLVDSWLVLARAYQKNGDPLRAIASGEKAISLAPGNINTLLMCGDIALQTGKVDLVHQHAEAALRLDPSNPHALLLLVRSLAIEGEPEEALEALDQFLPSASDPYPLKVERIALIRKISGIQATVEALQILAEEYPEEPVVLGLLAESLAAVGQRAEAERTAQAALQLRPDQPDLHLLVGRIQRITGHLDQAIYHLSESVQQAPDQIEAYLELGRAFQERREPAQALKVYKKAIQVASCDPRPFYQAGLALKENKDYVGAEAMLRRAAELAPEDVNIRRQLGAIIALNLVHNPQEA